jgi:WD40 repeat protein
MLASISPDKTVRLWKVSDGSAIQTLDTETDEVQGVAFSPDGQTLAWTAGNTVQLWNVPGNSSIDMLQTDNTYTLMSVAFSPDGRTLAEGSLDGTARLWQVP